MSTIQLNVWGIVIITVLSVIQCNVCVICLTGLRITLPLCLLLSILYNNIPCEHKYKLKVWVSNILASLDMFIFRLQFNMISLTSPKSHQHFCLLSKIVILFYLDKNQSGQNQSSQTASAGLGTVYLNAILVFKDLCYQVNI